MSLKVNHPKAVIINKGGSEMDYEKRTDFRALDVTVDALDSASLPDLRKARATCREMSKDLRINGNRRLIWKDLATMIGRIMK